MLVATLLAFAQPAIAGPTVQPYEPDPYGWPVEYIDESYPWTPGLGGGAQDDPQGVVNGTQVKKGDWDDAVGIVFYGYYVGCTGTLIDEKVVLTAGHCAGGITDVIIGTKDWTNNDGEIIGVSKTIEYPNSQSTYDVSVLKLEKASDTEPRYIAIDCILDEYLEDGAEVAVVGFGSTDYAGSNWNTKLMEGYTNVQDSDCDETMIDGIYAGCNQTVSPGGEIGAGGNNVDSCFGDSGGPLYLLTPEGDFLVGATSRSYLGVPYETPCKLGGIYVRPDAVFDWIEESVGHEIPRWNCNDAPQVTAEPIVVKKNQKGESLLTVVDDGVEFTVEVLTQPAHGVASVEDGGLVVYEPDGSWVGADDFVVSVTDDGSDQYERSEPVTLEVPISVTVEKGVALFGGCDTSGAGGAGLAWLVVAGMAGVRRRR